MGAVRVWTEPRTPWGFRPIRRTRRRSVERRFAPHVRAGGVNFPNHQLRDMWLRSGQVLRPPRLPGGLTSACGRSVPDVAIDADPALGLQICEADDGGCPAGSFGGVRAWRRRRWRRSALSSISRSEQRWRFRHDPVSDGRSRSSTRPGPDNDFAHVGLGSPDFARVSHSLSGTLTGRARRNRR